MSARGHKKKRIQDDLTQLHRLPKARRKGGQYIYPAGAYRNARIAPPASMPKVISAAPAVIPETPPVLTSAFSETLPSESRKQTNYRYAAAAAFVMIGMLGFSISRTRPAAAVTKLMPSFELHEGLEINEEPLTLYVNLETVRAPLEEYLSEQEGDWAVWLKNLESGQEMIINDHQMPSASLIKLFVAGCYFEQVESGALAPTTRSEDDLEAMISWSDNDAWMDLETIIGKGSYDNGLKMVTAFAAEHGYEHTGRLIGGDSIYAADAANLTSVSDVGKVLDEINEGTFVSKDASETILDLMLEQKIVTKIPAGLPEGISSANKTGELTGIENDAAIVYGDDTDYILVIMSDDNYIGTSPLAEISKMVYEALNPDEEPTEDL